jgi:hypothetical protein
MSGLAQLMLVQVWQHYFPKSAVKQDADSVVYGANRIHVSVVPENGAHEKGKFFWAARYEISINGEQIPALTHGTVGVDDTQDGAVQTAFQDWAMGFGYPFIRVLEKAPDGIAINGQTWYAGPLGIRGLGNELPGGWVDGSNKMHQKILASTTALQSGAKNSSGFRSEEIMIAVPPTGDLKSECRINGEISPAAVAAINKLDWPRRKTAYFFKQYYVMRESEK